MKRNSPNGRHMFPMIFGQPTASSKALKGLKMMQVSHFSKSYLPRKTITSKCCRKKPGPNLFFSYDQIPNMCLMNSWLNCIMHSEDFGNNVKITTEMAVYIAQLRDERNAFYANMKVPQLKAEAKSIGLVFRSNIRKGPLTSLMLHKVCALQVNLACSCSYMVATRALIQNVCCLLNCVELCWPFNMEVTNSMR